MLLVVDGNNVAWAAFHALGRAMGAETPEQKARATLIGLTQSVLGFAARGGSAVGSAPTEGGEDAITGLVVAFDQGRPLRRRAIYPAYQTGREGQSSFMDNEPYVLEGIAEFEKAADMLPGTILRGENTEADDLVAAYVVQAAPTKVRIASTDRDFLQLVDERVSIYSPVKKVVIDDANFDEQVLPKDKSGEPIRFPRERFVDFRALSGDSSDDLPGVPGVGALTAAAMLRHAPLDAYFEDPSLVASALGRANRKVEAALALPDTRDIVERNRALMDLRAAAELYADLAPYRTQGRWDRDGFEAWLDEQRIPRLNAGAVTAALEGLATAPPHQPGL